MPVADHPECRGRSGRLEALNIVTGSCPSINPHAHANAASVVPQIIDMARTLNLGIVVEGIEADAQADYFRNAGWPVSRHGGLFGCPMPAAQYVALMMKG
jgi:EAL domain-containing protein (putative c-di-GMP-specific phosphodiesterase class I)